MIEKNLAWLPTDLCLLITAGLVIILLIVTIIQIVKCSNLKKRLDTFMEGKDAKSLENTLIKRLDEIDELNEKNKNNEKDIKSINERMKSAFQKYALLKYDAFEESGGRMSTVLVMLDEKNNGYILNVVHGREGSYTYTKEIIDGNAIVQLGKEEEQALDEAINKNAGKD